MNKTIRHVSVVTLVLFLSLFAASTWIQFVKAPELNADSRNVRSLYREFGTNRGPILVEGKEIVHSVPSNDSFKYDRVYTDGELYASVTGFYSVVYGRTGIELAANEYLNGSSDSLWWSRPENLMTGADPQGSSVELTLNEAAQRAAYDALGDQRGAAVALDVETGAILALVSKPSFDPNLLAGHVTADVTENYKLLTESETRPMVNRAIAGNTYPPGSTFKLITAAATLEDGLDPETQVEAPRTYTLPQTSTTLNNYGGSSCTSAETMSLSDALRISCNTAFAILGNDLGPDKLAAQAEKFGFGQTLEVPLRVTPSSFPANLNTPNTALSAIGQFEVKSTPLQIAMVSAAIANRGKSMEPYLIQEVLSPKLNTVFEASPKTFGKPVSAKQAAALTEMMVGVVESGTGTAAKIKGVSVAGKTGTAETGTGAAPHAWFTGFAPADNPKIAVAVIVENGGDAGSEATGGAVAAPIARSIMKAVLDQ